MAHDLSVLQRKRKPRLSKVRARSDLPREKRPLPRPSKHPPSHPWQSWREESPTAPSAFRRRLGRRHPGCLDDTPYSQTGIPELPTSDKKTRGAEPHPVAFSFLSERRNCLVKKPVAFLIFSQWLEGFFALRLTTWRTKMDFRSRCLCCLWPSLHSGRQAAG